MTFKEALNNLHSHPGMEKLKGITEDHVVIDRDVYEALRSMDASDKWKEN